MADILIKGMEKPKKGHFLFQISANGDVWVSNRNDEGTGIIIAKAIELPPHGRLIDADYISHEAYPLRDDTGQIRTVVDLEDIDNAPTILEANNGLAD